MRTGAELKGGLSPPWFALTELPQRARPVAVRNMRAERDEEQRSTHTHVVSGAIAFERTPRPQGARFAMGCRGQPAPSTKDTHGNMNNPRRDIIETASRKTTPLHGIASSALPSQPARFGSLAEGTRGAYSRYALCGKTSTHYQRAVCGNNGAGQHHPVPSFMSAWRHASRNCQINGTRDITVPDRQGHAKRDEQKELGASGPM